MQPPNEDVALKAGALAVVAWVVYKLLALVEALIDKAYDLPAAPL